MIVTTLQFEIKIIEGTLANIPPETFANMVNNMQHCWMDLVGNCKVSTTCVNEKEET